MINMLVVEDNIHFSKILINKIVQANKQIRLCMIATDGKEALDIIEKEKIDIILLDLNIPKYNGIQILEFLEKNKKEDYTKSIIVVSGETKMLENVIDNTLVYSYILKSQIIDEVVDRVNEICKEKEFYLREQKQLKEKRKIIMKKIDRELINLGYNIKYIGTGYLSDSIYLLYFSPNRNKMKLERDIYSIIAQNNNTTINTVKCDIIRATNQAEKNCEQRVIKEYFGHFIDKKIKPKLVINTILRRLN